MPPSGGTRTQIDQGIIDRLSGAVRSSVDKAVSGLITGASEAWFGPLQPLEPQAPKETAGRAFDYNFGHNMSFVPKGEQGQTGVDFTTLRALADPSLGGLDLMRLAIETVKDRLSAQKWTIKPREESEAGEKLSKGTAEKLLRPDGIHTFRVWSRMLFEDLLVIDAPTVYLAPTTGTDKVPEVVDGATIKILIRPDGRSPVPPEPAYQQRLKGLAAVNYSRDEIIYGPRNLRSNRLYGYGPVEQVISTVNIALRRQLSQLEYYTAGSVPDMILGVPETWNASQIKEFQLWWDSVLSGNTEERRRARFVPGGIKPFVAKEGHLKDAHDEWLARIICYCFNLSPSALIKDVNRATAETSKEASAEDGLEPLKLWWSDYMDEVIAHAYENGDQLQFTFQDEEIPNPEIKARVYQIAVGNKPWLTPDEVRKDYGRTPLTPEQKLELAPPAPVVQPTPEPGQLELPGTKPTKPEPKPIDSEAEKVAKSAAGRSLQGHRPGSSCLCQVHKRYP